MAKDLYHTLGVKESATADEIKRAYRELAKKYHPDKTGGDKHKESRFKEVSAAYDVLSDETKRRQYDAMRHGGPIPGFGGGGNPFASGMGGGVPGGMGGLEDILSQMFGQGAGHVVFEQELRQPGRRPHRPAPPRPAAPPPDRIVRTPEGAELTRRGDDLHVDVPLSIEEAVLGAKVPVPTMQGPVTLTIPPGTSSGKRLRLRGKGFTGQGDLYVTVQIVVPAEPDERAREALREFSRLAPVKPRR